MHNCVCSSRSPKTHVLALELVDHEGSPTIAHEVHVSHPYPVLGNLGPCDQEAREEEQDGDVSG